jgi:hypothetical protein
MEATMTAREFETRWEGALPATPQQAWEAITKRADGWLWPIEYEPRVGGAERGLTSAGGVVSAWEPPRHFATRAERDDGWFNELDYSLRPRGVTTYLRYVHRTAFGDDYAIQADMCRAHTAFYNHSLGEYLRHFAGRQAVYVHVDAPEASRQGGLAKVRCALGLDGAAIGDRMRLVAPGLDPIEGVVDYATDAFLGVRSGDALYRFYGRDAWGWPVGIHHHLFAASADPAAAERMWGAWLSDVFATEAVA